MTRPFTGYLSQAPLQIEPGSVIRVVGSYQLLTNLLPINYRSQSKPKTIQLRTDWLVERWSGIISLDQITFSITETLFKKIFSSLQGNQVIWTKLTFSFPSAGNWNTFKIPISNITGAIPEIGDGRLGIELTSAQKPLSRYTINLAGVPRQILGKRRDPTHPQAKALELVERCLISPIKIPIYRLKTFPTGILDLSQENLNYYSPFSADPIFLSLSPAEKNYLVSLSPEEQKEVLSLSPEQRQLVFEGFSSSSSYPKPPGEQTSLEQPKIESSSIDGSAQVILRFTRLVSENASPKTKNKVANTQPIVFNLASANFIT